jgi:hypothetical protein
VHNIIVLAFYAMTTFHGNMLYCIASHSLE